LRRAKPEQVVSRAVTEERQSPRARERVVCCFLISNGGYRH
jgi:hypothetical protein